MVSPVIILALIITIVHYFSDKFSHILEKFHFKIASFSAGVLLAIIFLDLFPEVVKGIAYVNIFFIILVGFCVFHIAEKYLYQHVKNKDVLMENLAALHIVGFFINHFIVGVVLVLTFSISKTLSFLLFIPFLLHTLSSALSLKHIDERTNTLTARVILSLSTFLGVILAQFLQFNQDVFYIILSFSIGALLYIVIRDLLPKEEEGKPVYFIFGLLSRIVILFFV